jgi:prepilin-type N-terminal cleavage/methylation domain-containing protein
MRRAFTIVELLVVMSIITLLIALLLPRLSMSRQAAQNVLCLSNFHEIGYAMRTLGDDNFGRLPGLWGPPWTGPGPLDGSFMGKEVFTGPYQPPPAAKRGTLVSYLGGDEAARKLYRCPSQPVGTFGSGVGSNGYFDYTMFQCFPGAKFDRIDHKASYIDPESGQSITVPVPILIEEDPWDGINRTFIDFGHTSINRFSSVHLARSGNYLTTDCSAQHLAFGTTGPQGWDWTTRGRLGPTNMGIATNWGKWN